MRRPLLALHVPLFVPLHVSLAMIAAGPLACDGALDVMPGVASDSAPPSAPLDSLIGEIHLHQFPRGSHAWAGFLSTPVPLARPHADQLVEYEEPIVAREGPCALHLQPTCTPLCQGDTWCSSTNRCSPFERLRYVDAGEITVVGSRLVPSIRMYFNSEGETYLTDPPAGPTQLFAGGENLQLRGGKGPFAFSGSLPAPTPVTVRVPDLTRDLQVPLDGDFEVKWASESSIAIVVAVFVSAHDGPFGYIRCNTSDTGALVMPASMIRVLPRPPRDTRIEVERYEERVFQTAGGRGIVVNAAQTTWKNGVDL